MISEGDGDICSRAFDPGNQSVRRSGVRDGRDGLIVEG